MDESYCFLGFANDFQGVRFGPPVRKAHRSKGEIFIKKISDVLRAAENRERNVRSKDEGIGAKNNIFASREAFAI